MADVKAKISAELLSDIPHSGANILFRGSNADVLFLWALMGLHLSQDAGIPLSAFVSMVMTSISAVARDMSKVSVDFTAPTAGKDGAPND